MLSGPVSFEEIVQNVKDATGFENITPLLDKLRRFVFRAERQIGYGGAIVMKRMVVNRGQNFDGHFFTYPPDYIEMEGIGNCGGKFCGSEYALRPNGIRMKKLQEKVVMLYWGVVCDGYGNPVTTRNHEEAVVNFCVWNLYKMRRFVDRGNANTSMDYERQWVSSMLASRGDDAFPTLEQWNELTMLSVAERRHVLLFPIATFDYCDDNIQTICDPATTSAPRVWYWQAASPAITAAQIIPTIDMTLLNTKPNDSFANFEIGRQVDYSGVGRGIFVIGPTENQSFMISDLLSYDVTDEFDYQYIPELKLMVYVSRNYWDHSSIFYKFKQIYQTAPSMGSLQNIFGTEFSPEFE